MSDIKMSEWFKLPVTMDVITAFPKADFLTFIGGNNKHLSSHHVEKIEHAINDHDRLTEENAQLKSDKVELIAFVESLQLGVSNEIKLEELLIKVGGAIK